MRRSFFIVLNPSAGVPRRRFFADVIAGLAARGASATVVEHGDPATAAAAVRAALGRHDAIVAAGGDGTARQVAASIGDAEMPMGLIPLGTGNVLAREIGSGTAGRRRGRDAATRDVSKPCTAPWPTVSRFT